MWNEHLVGPEHIKAPLYFVVKRGLDVFWGLKKGTP